jgi:hypothetical protein
MAETEEHKEVYNLINVIKSKDGKSNLHEHLMKLYEAKVELNDDKKFLDLLEDISIKIKTQGNYSNQSNARDSLLNYLAEYEKNAKNKKALIGPLIKKNPDGGDPEIITQVNFVPEYHNIFQTLEWVGISIGEKESYLLTNSLRSLVSNKGLPGGVTFWGKIYGREKDYYIAEATGVEASAGKKNFDLFFKLI